jgi:predicted ester cyclase
MKPALLLALISLATTVFAADKSITEAEARKIIAPLYANFSMPIIGDTKNLLEQGTTKDWVSCSDEDLKHCRGREESIKAFAGYAKAIPDMKHVIKEIIVMGNKIVVRGELSGTPAGDFFGVPHSGKSFKIMAIDIQTITGNKISKSYHLEDWASALNQLRAK